MDVTDESLIMDETAENEAYREAWPILPDDYVKEFEEYLMEIGLRY